MVLSLCIWIHVNPIQHPFIFYLNTERMFWIFWNNIFVAPFFKIFYLILSPYTLCLLFYQFQLLSIFLVILLPTCLNKLLHLPFCWSSSGSILFVSKLSLGQAAYHFLAGYQNGKFLPAYSKGPSSIDPLRLAMALCSKVKYPLILEYVYIGFFKHLLLSYNYANLSLLCCS